MDIIEELRRAKNGDTKSIDNIIKHYENYIKYNMNKYSIRDQYECCEEVKQKIRNVIFLFKIEKR